MSIARDRRLLGARLREARKRRGIGVRELGRQTDCSASLISQIELGKIAPSVSTLYTLTSSLGVSIDSLFVSDETSPEGAAPDGATLQGAVQLVHQELHGHVDPAVVCLERRVGRQLPKR